MPTIHPTAVIAAGAEIGRDCDIGPYCVVGEHVRLGDRCVLQSHVVLDGHTSIGEDCEIFSFACLGKQTQDLKYQEGDVSYVRVGARTTIREYVTMNACTAAGKTTAVGDDCLIQSYCHIAHECVLGNHVIMSSGSMMAGHVEVDDYAVIGGKAGIVQFCKIGRMAMVGGFSKLVQDVMPFCIADGNPAFNCTINKVGMERNGLDRQAIRAVTNAFKKVFRSGLALEEAARQLREEYPDSPEIAEMLAFVEKSDRGLARPSRQG